MAVPFAFRRGPSWICRYLVILRLCRYAPDSDMSPATLIAAGLLLRSAKKRLGQTADPMD
jgi:hypothetical protein